VYPSKIWKSIKLDKLAMVKTKNKKKLSQKQQAIFSYQKEAIKITKTSGTKKF
jgi:hypothetical protein